jgi:hypothetical protein
MRAIHLTAFGDPAQGLEFVQIQEPAAPSHGQALIGVEFSPIDLSDLLVVSGAYPFRPSLPSVIGNEGVGRILAVGPGVDNVAVGDRVLTPLYGLAWAERIVVPAEGLFALPADVDPQQLAMLTINPPTAGLLLSEFVDLAAGDRVVQNAANSGVGRAVIAFAKATIPPHSPPHVHPDAPAMGPDRRPVERGAWNILPKKLESHLIDARGGFPPVGWADRKSRDRRRPSVPPTAPASETGRVGLCGIARRVNGPRDIGRRNVMVWRIKSINHVAIPSHETEATFENAVRDALAAVVKT